MKTNATRHIGPWTLLAVVWLGLAGGGEGRTHFYDTTGRLVMVAEANGTATRYSYDDADNLTSVEPLMVPRAPGDLAAVRTLATTAALSWTDASDDETSFAIWRRSANDYEWEQIATVAAGVTSYTDDGLTAGENFVYRVAARRGGDSSAFSDAVAATTEASERFSLASFRQVSDPLVNDHILAIEFDTIPGETYVVESSDNLHEWDGPMLLATTPGAVPAQSSLTGTGARVTIYLRSPAQLPSGYFRVVRE